MAISTNMAGGALISNLKMTTGIKCSSGEYGQRQSGVNEGRFCDRKAVKDGIYSQVNSREVFRA